MLARQHIKSIQDSARSLAVSLFVHVVVLLGLYFMIVKVVQYETVQLTAQSAKDVVDQAQFVVPKAITAEARQPQPDKPVDVDPLQSTQLLTSVNLDDLRTSIRRSGESVRFFGSEAYGNRFVYILDVSVSMSARKDRRFQRAKDELIRSVSQLSEQQSYYVFLFCYETCRMFGHPSRSSYRKRPARNQPALEYVRATSENLAKLKKWLYQVRLASGTDPRRALSLAHSMDPDAVFILSDGQFNRPIYPIPDTGWIDQNQIPDESSVVEGVELSLSDVSVHTIAFENPFTRETMERIAEITGGSSRYVKTQSLQPLKSASLVNGLIQLRRNRARNRGNPDDQHAIRLKHAKECIEDGELAFAEYLIRPIRHLDFDDPRQESLANRIDRILTDELGDTRVEDFKGVSIKAIEKKALSNRYANRYRF